MRLKTIRRLRVATAVLLAIFIFLFACDLLFVCAALTVDRTARVTPSYEKIDLEPILEKPRAEWSDDDFAVLSRQTGILLREAFDGLEADEIRAFQDAFFFEGDVEHEEVAAGLVYHDILIDPADGRTFYAPIVALEPGDVLISSTSHLFGWRHGHAALVLTYERLLQSAVIGTNSSISNFVDGNGIGWFTSASNFMVLRLKGADADARRAIAEEAEKDLVGVPYHFTAGIFTPKDQGTSPTDTYCSHLVWQAFKNAGYDLDADGGPCCTPRDIANSSHLEVVQTYGFDIDKGW